jgi:hypothetical protein
MERAQRALAYARVYAGTDEALSAQVERVGQGQVTGATPLAKRKPKARKARHEADLFPVDENEAAVDALPM